jgi:RimJ/RimL family protein N-acetyltransferase
VVEKAGGEVVGSCGFGLPSDASEVEFGYVFGRAHWGKGYATEAALACMRYGFERLGFEEVVASVAPQNLASARVLEKVGFELRGMRRFDGEAEDSLYYLATRPGGATRAG